MGSNRFRRAAIATLVAGLMICLSFGELRDARETMSLDGVWEIAFDPENVGRRAGWNEDAVFTSLADRRQIVVPSCWELIERDYEGVAFYRRTFNVPAEWPSATRC